jgi:hypothetical protein
VIRSRPDKLRDALSRKKWSRRTLIRKTRQIDETGDGVSVSTIQRYFREPNPAREHEARLVCEALNIPLHEGFEVDGQVSETEIPGVDIPLVNGAAWSAGRIERVSRQIVGRSARIREICRRLQNDDGDACVFLHAPPGLGKTGLLARFADASGENCITHFFSRMDNDQSPEFGLWKLIRDIAERFLLPVPQRPGSLADHRAVFRQMLELASVRLKAKQRLVIVIDACDEIDRSRIHDTSNPLGLPANPPPGIRILLSSRKLSDKPFLTSSISLSTSDADQQAAIQEYVDQQFRLLAALKRPPKGFPRSRPQQTELQRLMIDRSEFNFMYLICLFNELRTEHALGEDLLARLPAGLERYYEDHWSRVVKPHEFPTEAALRALVCLTIDPRRVEMGDSGPIPASWLRAVTGAGDAQQLHAFLDRWSMFLDVSRHADGERRYSFYHETYREFLRDSDHLAIALDATGITVNDVKRDILRHLTDIE